MSVPLTTIFDHGNVKAIVPKHGHASPSLALCLTCSVHALVRLLIKGGYYLWVVSI